MNGIRIAAMLGVVASLVATASAESSRRPKQHWSKNLLGCLGLCRERCPVCPYNYLPKPSPDCPPAPTCKDADDYLKKPPPGAPATVCKDPNDYQKKPGVIRLEPCSPAWYSCGVLSGASGKSCRPK